MRRRERFIGDCSSFLSLWTRPRTHDRHRYVRAACLVLILLAGHGRASGQAAAVRDQAPRIHEMRQLS